MHPALILAGTINLDKSSHNFFHLHCHLLTPMIIMEHPLMSYNVASSSTSIHCIKNYPVQSSYAPIDQHTPFNDLASSIITFISSRTIHEQFKLTCHPY